MKFFSRRYYYMNVAAKGNKYIKFLSEFFGHHKINPNQCFSTH